MICVVVCHKIYSFSLYRDSEMAMICFLAMLACKSMYIMLIKRLIMMMTMKMMVGKWLTVMVMLVMGKVMVVLVKMVMVSTSSLGSPGRLYGMRRSTERIRGRNLVKYIYVIHIKIHYI